MAERSQEGSVIHQVQGGQGHTAKKFRFRSLKTKGRARAHHKGRK